MARRNLITQEERQTKTRQANENFIQYFRSRIEELPFANVAVYQAVGGELQLDASIEFMRGIGLKLYFPRMESFARGEMKFFSPQDESWQKNAWGIPEPIPEKSTPWEGGVFDLVLVPGVAFSRKGDRLGMGQGFYDRFLAGQGGALKIAVCFKLQILDELPLDPWDKRVDLLITEEGIHELGDTLDSV